MNPPRVISPDLDKAAVPRRRGRPPKDPAIAATRRRLIRAGLIHLTEKGYTAAGIDEILRDAGVPKGSFYHYFRNKADFGAQLIDAYQAYFAAKLDKTLLDETLAPIDRLVAFTSAAEHSMARHDFRRGCLVGNLGQEMGALPEAFRDRLISVLLDWQRRTACCLRAAQDQGTLSRDQDADALAAFFWIGWEGAVLRAKLERGPGPLRTFADCFFRNIATKETQV